MILFFDRSLGRGIPRALKRLKRFPCGVEMHDTHFPNNTDDDVWMPQVAQRGWTVIGQDYNHHKNESELYAIKTYGLVVFYLWGGDAPQWEQFRVLARAWDKMVRAAEKPGPRVWRITKNARLAEVRLK